MTNKEVWNNWTNIHEESEQKKRQASASKTPCTPISINTDECNGVFQGSSGTHTTTLEACSCIDFNRRKKPCKHMYRLAMELHIFDRDFQSNKNDVVRVRPKSGIKIADAVKLVETLSREEQKFLLEVLYDMKFNYHSEFAPINIKLYKKELSSLIDNGILEISNDFDIILAAHTRNELNQKITNLNLDIKFKKNMKKADLITWIKEYIPEHIKEICSDFVTVIVTSQFLKSKHKLYLYLSRIYRNYCDSNYPRMA